MNHRHCSRALVAALAAALGIGTACSTLQTLGSPVGHGRPGTPASRAHVSQVLQERAPSLEDQDRERVVDAIFAAHAQHGFEPSLLLALMDVESGFNPAARSHKGALGLMQVLPFSGRLMARELGIKWQGAATLLDPEHNVKIGIAYLARMQETFRDLELSLAAYNVGPGRLQQILDSGKRPAGIYSGKVFSRQAALASNAGFAEQARTP